MHCQNGYMPTRRQQLQPVQNERPPLTWQTAVMMNMGRHRLPQNHLKLLPSLMLLVLSTQRHSPSRHQLLHQQHSQRWRQQALSCHQASGQLVQL